MAISKLEKASITVLEGSRKDEVIYVLFNPSEYSLERTNAYKSTAVPGLGSPLIQFINGEAGQLSMELFLDDRTDPKGPVTSTAASGGTVQDRYRQITSLLYIDRDLHAPPPVRFQWGPLEFKGVLEKVGRKVTLFRPDGAPSRLTLTVAFKEYRTLAQQMREPRRESADKSKRRVVVGRDSLWLLAAREYRNPAEWRLIAEANDLDDPRDIQPGDWLILPPLEQDSGSRGSV